VRPAREADAAELAPILGEADAVHARISPRYFLSPPSESFVARATALLRQVIAAEHEVVLVAEDTRRRLCGLVHVRLYDTPLRPDMVAARRAQVERVVVAPRRRRRGCGRALLGAAQAWARRRGASELVLTVWAGNPAAEQFYAALGFHSVSRVLGTPL
jgi:GNAT superfamily N-acetyltransferase